MKVGITATRKIPHSGKKIIHGSLVEHDWCIEEVTSGGADGGDYEAIKVVHDYLPLKTVNRLIVPDAYWNKECEKYATEVIQAKTIPYADTNEPYRYRNTLILDHSEVLFAYPKTKKEEFRGSGTWMTIRMAIKRGIPVWVWPLNGDLPYKL